MLPKKSMQVSKCQENIQLIVVNNEVVFFNQRDGLFFPTLKLLHQYPSMMPRLQVDKGAIRFVLGGANIMCPGFTSPGGALPSDAHAVEAERAVAIYAENKQHAMAVGTTKMSTQDIARINKGVAVENAHFLLDGLWLTKCIN